MKRYHIEKSTRVACKYLLKAKERFGSWTLAAASYNMGMYGIDRLLEKQQTSNYYDLLLNNETRIYFQNTSSKRNNDQSTEIWIYF